ncbi:hypothetical protein MBLNU457_3326t1 [Dothideomycetes sp. NU457]
MTTTIDLTELGEALPHDAQKILINIDDEEYDWIFLAHETIDMIKVFTTHAQQYDMLPMSFCYTMGDYQLSGRETPRSLGLRAEDVIVATWLPDVALAINSFSSHFALDAADLAAHDLPQDVDLASNQSVRDEEEDFEDEEDDVDDEEGEILDDEDIDEPFFIPEQWEGRNQQIQAMVAAHDAQWDKKAIVQQHTDDQRGVEDKHSLQTVKNKDDDVEMAD